MEGRAFITAVILLYKSKMNIGEKIKQLRKKNGLTQEQLAEYVDVSITSIRRWEWGKIVPNAKYVQKLAEVLKTTPEDLLEDQTWDIQVTKNDGMAIMRLGEDKDVSVPATPEGYAFLKDIFLASLSHSNDRIGAVKV